MRALYTAKRRRIVRSLVGSLAVLLAFALMTVTLGPTLQTTHAQDVQDAPQATDTVFSNPSAIAPADRTSNSAGTNPGLPPLYPSPIVVSGLNGTIAKVTVTFAMTSTFPDDFDILLAGPTGARSLVISDAGGSGDPVNVSYTFDQTAATVFPDGPTTIVAAGTYRPANYTGLSAPEPGGMDNFPAPGPGVMSYPTDFNIFNGTNPNGTWNLFVVDDQVIDTMSLPSGWSIDITVAGGYRPVLDFTGDASTDFTTMQLGAAGSPIIWKTLRNPALPGPAFIRYSHWGSVGDGITPGDFQGDSKTELSVWRSGVFYTAPFPEGTGPIGPMTVTNWGSTGDNLGRDGDYDGDGKDDYTVVRIVSSVLQWHMRLSGGGTRVVSFGSLAAGVTTFAFQGADFTGDGREEIVICNVSNATGAATWFIGDSVTGAGVLTAPYGNFNTDFILQPDDYNGDGKADIVVWRAGGTGADARAWYIRDTMSGGTLPVVIFGIGDPSFINNDIPLRGNYDGDNKADRAVFRRSTREWFWIKSTDNTLGYQQWGEVNDSPLPNFFTF